MHVVPAKLRRGARPGPSLAHCGAALLVLIGVGACSRYTPPADAVLVVRDSRGDRPVFDAEVVIAGERTPVDGAGRASVSLLDGPVLAVIEADGFIPEPVILGLEDAGEERSVSLWDGDRFWSMHVGGDVMLGRRYLTPTAGEPHLDPADPGPGAAEVVSDLAPAFAAADLRMVNLETVVGTLPDEQAYPAKRFLLQTPPGALDALQAMQVDAVDLANNHAYDWLDPGVEATLDALAEASLPSFGAGRDAAAAAEPLILDVHGVRVGIIGFTSVDGSFVNDSYPQDEEPEPADIEPSEAWQYERRSWGFESDGWSVPVADRRAGTAWQLFAEVEDALDPSVAADAWSSLRAVYPELQDWVAGRGHGGAAPWTGPGSRDAIEDLDRQVDVVVVQIHGGFQFSPGVSSFVDTMGRQSVEAGADLVVAHHPHVLQGASYHQGALIVHSLGNLVFDQDFLATFPSAYLRTIWEGDELVDARLVPLEIVDYRPVPVADAAARRTLHTVWERSRLGGFAGRVDGEVKLVQDEYREDSVPATVRVEGHMGVLLPDEPVRENTAIEVPSEGFAALPADALVDPRLGGVSGEVDVARDLFGWGSMVDVLADAQAGSATHWVLDSNDERVVRMPDGQVVLELERDGFDEEIVTTRSVSRVPLVAHRLWSSDGEEPLDPPVRYAVRVRARGTGAGAAQLRLTFYDFDDTDPTRDPDSRSVADQVIELDVGRSWRDVVVDVDPDWLTGPDGAVANQILPFVRLEPPRVGRSVLQVSNLEVFELRRADAMPAVPGRWDAIRNRTDEDLSLEVPVLRP